MLDEPWTAIPAHSRQFATRQSRAEFQDPPMDTQRLISDARRRAKLLSRRDGRPYQTHLNEVAMQTGHDD